MKEAGWVECGRCKMHELAHRQAYEYLVMLHISDVRGSTGGQVTQVM